MKLLFLGTGAAGSVKRTEEEIVGKIRRCAALRIDSDVLVDVSRQSFDYLTKLGEDASQITDVFLSHAHGDHYCKEALLQFANASEGKLRFWCHSGAVEKLKLTEEDLRIVEVHPMEICEKYEVAGMTVTPLPANHLVGAYTSPEKPLHYVFEKDGKTLYYGCDGGWYTAIEWEYLRNNGVVFDSVIFDATVGEDDGNFRIATHNNLAMLKLLTLALRQNGMLKENATLIATHMANSCYDPQYTKEEVFAPLGIHPVVDGERIEI